MMETKKVYKVLLEEEDGELKSTIAGRGLGGGYLAQDKPRLTYKEGTITYAPEGTVGLFFEETLDKAERYAKDIPHTKGTVRIHEAISLGDRGHLESCGDTYPALLLGKEVWREKAPRPEPKFKVGDKVLVKAEFKGGTGMLPEIKQGTLEIVTVIDRGSTYSYTLSLRGYSASEKWLELAPKEKWVDVTSECVISGYFSSESLVGELKHKDKSLAWLSYDGIVPSSSCPDGYKLEPVRGWDTEGKCCHWVRVFHKQAN